MLAHPTQERLLALGLTGMATALEDQRRQPDIAALAFEERLALLLDRATMERENKRLVARLRFAALRQEAVVEDVDLRAPRGLDIGATTYGSIASILKSGLDRAYREEGAAEPSPIRHANIRGGGYYH